jgi:protein tyrosine/serine phosphatase
MNKKVFSKHDALVLTLLLLLLVTGVSAGCSGDDQYRRPSDWAQPLLVPGVENCYKISDNLYRGAQPTAEGMQNLEEMGIKTIINLRSIHSDKKKMRNTNLVYEKIPMMAFNPKEKHIVRFLELVTNGEGGPYFVHCMHGADRTGLLCASYRVAVQGWTKQEALREMVEGGFGFHKIWSNLKTYLKKLNIDSIRRKADLDS